MPPETRRAASRHAERAGVLRPVTVKPTGITPVGGLVVARAGPASPPYHDMVGPTMTRQASFVWPAAFLK